MDFFLLVGRWTLTSEFSTELLRFLDDGSYRIYYEQPYRLIEVGDWSVSYPLLIMSKNGFSVNCKIESLLHDQLILSHRDENDQLLTIKYKRILS
jgi:hypothetical protein